MRRAAVWRVRRTPLQTVSQLQRRQLTSSTVTSADNDTSISAPAAESTRISGRREAWPSLTERLLRTRQAVLADLSPRSKRPLYKPLNGRTTRINSLISRAAHRGDLAAALHAAAQLLEPSDETGKGKERVSRPDVGTYEALIAAYAHHGLYQQALDCLEDAKALDVELNANCWNQIIRAHVNADQDLGPVLEQMQQAGIRSTPDTLHHRFRQHIVRKDLEGALLLAGDVIQAARSSALPLADTIKRSTLYSVAQMAATAGEITIAVDLLRAWDSSTSTASAASTSTMLYHSDREAHDTEVLTDLLNVAVEEDDLQSTQYIFDGLRYSALSAEPSIDLTLLVTEGMTNQLLRTFSRGGDIEAMQFLLNEHLPALHANATGGKTRTDLSEWQVASLITAHMIAGDFSTAIDHFTRHLPQSSDANPTKASDNARKSFIEPAPKYHVFFEGLSGDADRVAASANYLIEAANGPTARVPAQFLNAVIKAALATHSDAISRIETILLQDRAHLPLDIDTFRFLYESCLPQHITQEDVQDVPADIVQSRTADIDRIERLLEHMRGYGEALQPDIAMYHTLIEVFTQAPLGDARWQNAFDYLEEMKHADIPPSAAAYSSLLKRLYAEEEARRADLTEEQRLLGVPEDPRIQLLIEEMAALGYLGGRVSNTVQRASLSRDLRELIGRERLEAIREQMLSPADRRSRMSLDQPRQYRHRNGDGRPQRREYQQEQEEYSPGSAADRVRNEQADRFSRAGSIDSLEGSIAKMFTLDREPPTQ